MSMHTLREYGAWLIVALLVLLLAVYGYSLSAEHRLLKVAVNQQDALSRELAEVVKTQLVKQGGYQVAFLKTKNSQESHRLLLKGDADLAILTPAALAQSSGVKALAPLASIATHLLVDKRLKIENFSELEPAQLALGAEQSDQRRLLEAAFEFIGKDQWLAQTQTLDYKALAKTDSLQASLVTTNLMDKNLLSLLATGQYRLQALPAEALASSQSMLSADVIPAFVDQFYGRDQSAKDVATLSAFIALVTTERLPATVAVDVSHILNNADSILSLAPFGRVKAQAMDTYSLLSQHSAVVRNNNQQLLSRYVAAAVNWLADYRWFLLALIVLLVLLSSRLRASRRYQQQQLTLRVQQSMDSLMQDMRDIEKQVGTAHDLRVLRGLYQQVLSIKERGGQLIMQQDNYPHAQVYLFLEQAHFSIQRLESRLGLMDRVRDKTEQVV